MSVQSEQPDQEADDIDRVRRAAVLLMEHFDTVQIFATRHVDDDTGTVSVQWGGGNWFARRGQIGEWVLKQDNNVGCDGGE